MRTLLPNLMAISLVVHAAVGCCWHHEHGCAHGDNSNTPICKSTQCCEHDDCPSHQGEAPEYPCHGKLECHGVCTYVAPQKIRLDSSLAVAPLASATLWLLFSDAQAAFGSAWNTADPAEFEPPLRLHLLHQIVLI